MKIKFKCLLIVETLIIILLMFLQLHEKVIKNNENRPFNRIINNQLKNIVSELIKCNKVDTSYKFIIIEDVGLNQDTVEYSITFADSFELITDDLKFNVLCDKIDGKEVVFRPGRVHDVNFKSIEKEMVIYLRKFDNRAANALNKIIEEDESGEDRNTLYRTEPQIPFVIAKFNSKVKLLSTTKMYW